MKTYSEKLRDPRWQKKRLKVMEYAHWRCQICGRKDSTLHCHHSYYTRGKEPWQYPDGSIICICQGCHEKIHTKAPAPEVPDFIPWTEEEKKAALQWDAEQEAAAVAKRKTLFDQLREAVSRTPE
jgi:hypothetical protein